VLSQLSRRATLIGLAIVVFASGALGVAVGYTWSKEEVLPVVLVKPGIGGFVPSEGSPIGNTWSKIDVRPMVIVKPGVGGFVPATGTSVGNTWNRTAVLPIVFVNPGLGGFVPSSAELPGGLPDAEQTNNVNRSISPSRSSATSPATIESKIDGNFDGWDGETIFRLTNGQIWQQTEFGFNYHFAFMPRVLIFRSGNGFKMQVDGVNKTIGVVQIR
jgi:hypothetical protein